MLNSTEDNRPSQHFLGLGLPSTYHISFQLLSIALLGLIGHLESLLMSLKMTFNLKWCFLSENLMPQLIFAFLHKDKTSMRDDHSTDILGIHIKLLKSIFISFKVFSFLLKFFFFPERPFYKFCLQMPWFISKHIPNIWEKKSHSMNYCIMF